VELIPIWQRKVEPVDEIADFLGEAKKVGARIHDSFSRAVVGSSSVGCHD
jgi:hypothetical protein